MRIITREAVPKICERGPERLRYHWARPARSLHVDTSNTRSAPRIQPEDCHNSRTDRSDHGEYRASKPGEPAALLGRVWQAHDPPAAFHRPIGPKCPVA